MRSAMPSATADLLDELVVHHRTEHPPWGFMHWLDAPSHDLTVKYLSVAKGKRTSLQRHAHKDELLIIVSGMGRIEAGGLTYGGVGMKVRIWPGTVHRVTGPLSYLEVSTYDDGSDTIRLEDDYGRES